MSINGATSARGLIRDSNRKWVTGFGMNIGFCSICMAEFWGLYQGLQLVWIRGIRFLEAEVDNLCILQMIDSEIIAPMCTRL